MSRKKYCLIGEITDFDYHGAWGDFCSPKSLKAFLDTLAPGEEAEIEINSPGGSVIQGIEMANAIKNCKGKIFAHVTGIAASMASVIACACHAIQFEEASFFMIHDPWSYCEGNAEEMRKQASLLDQMKAVIMSFYRGKFNRTEEEIASLMSDETWYTGSECKANGLDCEVIASDVRIAASIVGHKFAKMPEGAAKFMAAKELTDEGKAEIEAARQAAKAEVVEPVAEGGESSTSNISADGASVVEPSAPAAVEDWEARYKGASKKINELQAKLEKAAVDTVDYGKVVADLEKANARIAELDATNASNVEKLANASAVADQLNEFNDQVKNAGFENLAALIGAVSGLKADLETRDHDLAACREQLDHMKSTRDLLTGGVLSAANVADSYEAKMAAAKTEQERENLRALKRSGKIK